MNTYFSQNVNGQRTKEVSVFKTDFFSVFSLNEEGIARGLNIAGDQPPIRQPTLTSKQKAQKARAKKKEDAKKKACTAGGTKVAAEKDTRNEAAAAAQ